MHPDRPTGEVHERYPPTPTPTPPHPPNGGARCTTAHGGPRTPSLTRGMGTLPSDPRARQHTQKAAAARRVYLSHTFHDPCRKCAGPVQRDAEEPHTSTPRPTQSTHSGKAVPLSCTPQPVQLAAAKPRQATTALHTAHSAAAGLALPSQHTSVGRMLPRKAPTAVGSTSTGGCPDVRTGPHRRLGRPGPRRGRSGRPR